MITEINIRLVPDDSLTEAELERVLRVADDAGQTPGEFVASLLRKAINEKEAA